MTLPRIDVPEEGYYWTKLVRNGPRVGARIWRSVARDPQTGETLDRSPVMLAELNGRMIDPYDLWTRVAGRTITKAEFDFLKSDSQWAAEHMPTAPEPTEAVDLRKVAPIGPPPQGRE